MQDDKYVFDEKLWEQARFIQSMLEVKGTVSVRVRKSLYDEAKKICEVTGVSVNDYVSAALAARIFRDKHSEE